MRRLVKKFLKAIAVVITLSMILPGCKKDSVTNAELLKYSQKDVIPLNDSLKALYYNDAAIIELYSITKDSAKIYSQVELDKSKISEYYNDLLYIYNYSHSLSNSFFENINNIHSFTSSILYSCTVGVDTSKKWLRNWIHGNPLTDIAAIDSIFIKYKLTIKPLLWLDGYFFTIGSSKPVNFYAIQKMLKNTGEFLYVEPMALTGGGSTITCRSDGRAKIYSFNYNWGDCPSGCLYYHYWRIRKDLDTIILIEEGGDKL